MESLPLLSMQRMIALCAGLFLAAPNPSPGQEVEKISPDLRREFKLAGFYQQVVLLEGFPIVASGKVSPYALREAAWIVQSMLGKRPDLLRQLGKSKARLAVMGVSEVTLDIPEHSDLRPPERWNRSRGLGATWHRPAVSCAEENMLCCPGDPYPTENILVHEIAHAVHLMAINVLDKTFDRRLKAAYRESLAEGRWKGTYAAGHYHEYWAEAVQCWFNTNRENDKIHNHVNTRKELKRYDPVAARFCEEVFGDNDWVYVRPDDTSRAGKGHLRGLDRSKLPEFEWRK